jgi:molecular chaperone GrpE
MNPKEQIPKPEESLADVIDDAMSSVDDFIRELEAKERDLHITADLKIEVEPSEFDQEAMTDFEAVEAVPVPEPSSFSATNGSTPANPRGSVEPGLKTRVFEEKSDRRLKDFESFKYRMDRERRGAFIDQIANLAAAMLPVLDNLDRALASVDRSKVDAIPEFSKFYDGIALVNQQVNEVLGEMGVEPIRGVGERFDPQFHEAVRHSMVKVTLGGPSSVRPTPQGPASVPNANADAVSPSADTAIEPAE